MAVYTPLKSDHQVMGEDFCSGYMDPFGNWNTGFPCPQMYDEAPGLCCGVDNLKYCCNGHGPRHIVNDVTHMPLVMGIVFGVSVAMIVSVVVCCFKCSCCLLYKKRQPDNTGPLYHLHCPSSDSNGGVANMYSYSSEATPQDTPRSSSRSHFAGVNNRWSTTTADSGPGLLSLDHHLALLEEASTAPIPAPFRPHNLSEEHLSNNGNGGRLPSSNRLSRALPDITIGLSREDEEPPPPYNSNHSTLIAVRPNHAPQGPYAHATTGNEANNTTNSNSRISSIVSTTDNHQESHFRAPPPSSLSSTSHSSNSLPQGLPTFLQQQNHRQRNISSSESASLRPQFIESRHQRHSTASVATEDSFIDGLSAFPPPPSENTASSAVSACNIFSLPAPPPPSFTLQQALDLHHNHNQQQQQINSSNNCPHPHSSSLNNQRSSSSTSSNGSSRTFAPVLCPTRRPCSTAHIIQMHNPHLPPDQQQLHMYTATKF